MNTGSVDLASKQQPDRPSAEPSASSRQRTPRCRLAMRRDSAAEPVESATIRLRQPNAGAPPGMTVQWDIEGSPDR